LTRACSRIPDTVRGKIMIAARLILAAWALPMAAFAAPDHSKPHAADTSQAASLPAYVSVFSSYRAALSSDASPDLRWKSANEAVAGHEHAGHDAHAGGAPAVDNSGSEHAGHSSSMPMHHGHHENHKDHGHSIPGMNHHDHGSHSMMPSPSDASHPKEKG
jgi:hypothetical protein